VWAGPRRGDEGAPQGRRPWTTLFALAAERTGHPKMTLVDATDQFCGSARCEAVVGNIVVIVDASHVSATYSRTLASFLRKHILHALP
jgi:SGNH domain (fused to AT3 domains)